MKCGVQTYDISTKQNFQMRATLMWTINDFLAYSMLARWSTTGKLACPYYIEYLEAFSLGHNGKISWFHNYQKFLPDSHPFKCNKINFLKGKVCTFEAPPILSSKDIFFYKDD